MHPDQHAALEAALAVMARMCIIDGHIADEERAFLQTMMPDPSPQALDQLLESVRHTTMAELCAHVTRYEDRFFIALRAYAMAHVDAHFDAEEEAAFERLIKALDILPEDVALIAAVEGAEDAAAVSEPPERLLRLYEQSSFVGTP